MNLRCLLGRIGSCLLPMVAAQRCAAVADFEPRQSDPLTESWRWHTFSQLSGLGATCMSEDASGSLWFGANSAIWEFDGRQWTQHPAETNYTGTTLTLASTPDGSLYAGGTVRLSRYRDGTWTPLVPRSGSNRLEIRKLLVAADGTVWAATARGLLQQDGEQWILHTDPQTAQRIDLPRTSAVTLSLLPPTLLAAPGADPATVRLRTSFADLCIDSSGRLWVATERGEVLCRENGPDGVTWRLYNAAHGIVLGRRPSLLVSADGSIHLAYGSNSHHLHHFDGTRWQATPLAELGLPIDGGHLFETSDGVRWFSGRYIVSALRDGVWQAYERPQFPIPSATNFLHQTRDGALWIAGPDTEVQRVDYATGRWETLHDLNFQWQSETGARWFLHRSGRVVVEEDGRWLSYGPEDGVIDRPVRLLGTSRGEVWAAGSHGTLAATSRFRDGQWQRTVHPSLAWGIDWRGVMETQDGSLWFSANVDSSAPAEQKAGILEFRDERWIHHHQPGREPPDLRETDPSIILPATQHPEPVGKFSSLGQSPDGRVWAGRNIIVVRDAQGWHNFAPSEDVRFGIIQTLFSAPAALWAGSRQFGALRHDGRAWIQNHGHGSLVANSVFSFARTTDGSIWAATDRGISRYDGEQWSANLLPPVMAITIDSGTLAADRNGGLWINHFDADWARQAWSKARRIDPATCLFQTTVHRPAGPPPETTITLGPTTVNHGAGFSVLWQGEAPWRTDADDRTHFSHRLNDGPWSPFSEETGYAFFSLPAGSHRLEVRARDRDYNVDPTPAVLEFTVLPPVWRQAWFIVVISLLVGAITAQTIRIFRERHQLRRTNRQLAAEIQRRTTSETALRQSEANLNEAQRLARLGSWTLIHADRRLEWSEEVYRIFETDPAHFTPTYAAFFAAVHPEDRDRVARIYRHMTEDGGTGSVEHRLLLPSGETRIVHERWTTQFDATGQPLRSLGTVQDVTTARRLEQQLLQSQKMEAIGQLAGGVAHDFNNILAAISMQAELALLDPDNPAETTTALDDIKDSAGRAARLTRQLLLFGRRQAMAPRTVDLNESVNQLTRMLRRIIGEDIHLDLHLHPSPLLTCADPTMLEQVLLNLAVNARDAMSEGGTLRIETAPRDLDPAQGIGGPQTTAGPGVWLAVSDTGTGIPPEVMAHIYEPFFSTKPTGHGTGLGLATVLGIVQQHHGLIAVHTEPGHGTRFEVTLPVASGSVSAPASLAPDQPPPGGTETILLVEDDDLLRHSATRRLTTAGYRVLTAAAAPEALALWGEHHEQIDLLFTDLVLPDSVNGLDLARRLRATRPDLPVLFTTGYSSKFPVGESTRSAGELLLQKPYVSDDLLRAIRQTLDTRPL